MGRPAWLGWMLLGVMLLGTAAACSDSSSNRKAFQPLNQAVADVEPSTIGKVVYDQARGSAKPLTQGPVRYLLVSAPGGPDTAKNAVDNRLNAAGFSELGPNAWRRVKDQATVLIYVKLFKTGQKTPNGLTVPAGHTGVWFNINRGT